MTGTTTPPKTAKYPTKLRKNYPRSRNGCLTCRKRKKKASAHLFVGIDVVFPNARSSATNVGPAVQGVYATP